MGVANKRTVFGAITLLIAFAAATLFVAFQPDAQAAQKPKADFQIDVFVTGTLASDVVRTIEKVAAASQHPRSLTPAFNVDSFFDITYSNIGSSGLDGIRASSFTVDSFFDIEYQIKGNDTGYWDTEMVSLSLTGIFGDPDFDVAAAEQVFAAVSAAVQGSTGGQSKHEFYGHVSILR
jgi:hypothetical protein